MLFRSELVTAAEQGDRHQTERKAHSLKGALRNLGGVKSGDTAYRIEVAAKEGNLSHAKLMLHDLETCVQEFQKEFRDFLATF